MISFLEAVKKVLIANGVTTPNSDPFSLINRYETFVARLYEVGYEDYLVEYDNDLSVRETIEIVLRDKSLLPYDEMKSLIERIRRADALLKSSFVEGKERPNVHEWWSRGIVKKGSGDYADDIKLEYDVIL